MLGACDIMSFAFDTSISLARIVLSFYGFWLVWRVLLPILPGPPRRADRLAPFARYFTDPLVRPLTERAGLHEWVALLLWLVLVAAALVALGRLGEAL